LSSRSKQGRRFGEGSADHEVPRAEKRHKRKHALVPPGFGGGGEIVVPKSLKKKNTWSPPDECPQRGKKPWEGACPHAFQKAPRRCGKYYAKKKPSGEKAAYSLKREKGPFGRGFASKKPTKNEKKQLTHCNGAKNRHRKTAKTSREPQGDGNQ